MWAFTQFPLRQGWPLLYRWLFWLEIFPFHNFPFLGLGTLALAMKERAISCAVLLFFSSERLPKQTLLNDWSQSTSFLMFMFGKGREIHRKCNSIVVGKLSKKRQSANLQVQVSQYSSLNKANEWRSGLVTDRAMQWSNLSFVEEFFVSKKPRSGGGDKGDHAALTDHICKEVFNWLPNFELVETLNNRQPVLHSSLDGLVLV